ncbi:hypothetical protein Ocin01_15439, partial [Orchesella cincta]
MPKQGRDFGTKVRGWLLQLQETERKYFVVEGQKVICTLEMNLRWTCAKLSSADIPMNKISNPHIRGFLEKYTKKDVPSQSTLRRNISDVYNEVIGKIRSEIGEPQFGSALTRQPIRHHDMLQCCNWSIEKTSLPSHIFLCLGSLLSPTIQQFHNLFWTHSCFYGLVNGTRK